VELSSNPLFLTVMCYIYVKNVIDAGGHDVSWVEYHAAIDTRNVLAFYCAILMKRRLEICRADTGLPFAPTNEYRDEKFQFLHYFAEHSFGGRVSI